MTSVAHRLHSQRLQVWCSVLLSTCVSPSLLRWQVWDCGSYSSNDRESEYPPLWRWAFWLRLGSTLHLTTGFYGKWTLTPANYFLVNLVDGKAAQYGVDPWWYYIEKLVLLMVPPFSLILLPAMVAAVILRPKNILVWTGGVLSHWAFLCRTQGDSFFDAGVLSRPDTCGDGS